MELFRLRPFKELPLGVWLTRQIGFPGSQFPVMNSNQVFLIYNVVCIALLTEFASIGFFEPSLAFNRGRVGKNPEGLTAQSRPRSLGIQGKHTTPPLDVCWFAKRSAGRR